MSLPKNTVNPSKPRPGATRAYSALLALLAVMTMTLAASPVLAQAPTGPEDPAVEPPGSTGGPSEVPPAGQGPTDGRELGAFMDGYFAQQLESSKIPGATVSVVKDGKVLFAKGYGEADVGAKEPVGADETLFRVGSVSKLITATAVMQLVEEGKLDLDKDVNRYLDDVEIPNTYPGRPVTLRHLLTHTAGFEQEFVGTGARGAADFEPLGEYLSKHVPVRVRPPGEVTSYSNYGMSLAGHAVEEASGMTYAQYVEENVAGPLGMKSTTAVQPPASGLPEGLSEGYDVEGGEPSAAPFEYIEEAPAGAVDSTATDMARFMIAHLQNGRYGDARILRETTAREMHERQFSNDPRLDGMGLGFYEQTINGERVIEHGGNTSQFHSLVALLPERGVGVFVSYNSYGDGPGQLAEYEMVNAFVDRYYPEEAPSAGTPEPSGTSGDAERVAGSYRSTRSNYTGFEKAFALAMPTSVTANEDGSITTSSGVMTQDYTPKEHRWVEDGPMVFRAVGGDERIAFGRDGEGRVTYLSTDADPTSAYEKLPSYESPKLHLGLLAGGLTVFGLTALAWPAGALTSRWYGRRYRKLYGEAVAKPVRGVKGARLARLAAWALCALALLLAGGMALAFSKPDEILFYGDSPVLSAVRALPFPIAALAAVVVVCAALSWRRRFWGLFGRLHYSLVALSALAFVALLGYYNLLGL